MKIKLFTIFLLCALILSSFVSCADPMAPTETSKIPEQSASNSPDSTAPDDTTTSENDTSAADETTSAPQADPSAKQIPDGYYANAETEFPLIITLGGNKVEATVRAVTLRTKLGTRALYLDALYDGRVVATKFMLGAAQVAAAQTTCEEFAILFISDRLDWSQQSNFELISYYISDLDNVAGTQVTLDSPEFQHTGSSINAGMRAEFDENPSSHKRNNNSMGMFSRTFSSQITAFEAKYSKLCVLLDSLSDLEKDIVAYPADGLTFYDASKLLRNKYFLEINQNYLDYMSITRAPNYFTTEYLPLVLPEGYSMPNYWIGGNMYYVTIDGVTYKCFSRMTCIYKGEEKLFYIDLVDIINRKILTHNTIDYFFTLYEHNDNFTSHAYFILETYKKLPDGKIEISTSEYAFTEFITDASGSTKAELAFRPVYNENNYSATVTLDPSDSESGVKIAEFGKKSAALAAVTEFGTTSFNRRARADNASTSAVSSDVVGSDYRYDPSFYTASGLKAWIFEIQPQY